ncbi:transmembrane protein 242 [Stigmatopora nigra]
MSAAEDGLAKVSQTEDEDKLQLIKGAVFLAAASSLGLIAGFGSTLALAKKNNPDWFSKGSAPRAGLPESGASLALRALGRGSAYAFCGVGLLSLAVCKMLGVAGLSDLKRKVGPLLPPIPKSHAAGSDPADTDAVFKVE